MNRHLRAQLMNFMHFVIIALLKVVQVFCVHERIPQHDSILTGELYFKELMNTRSSNRFVDQMRMPREYFTELHQILILHGSLKDSPKVKSGEKLMIFMHLLQGFSDRQLNERWQHSGDTISKVVHEVCRAILRAKDHFIQLPRVNDTPHERIRLNPKYWPFFDGCIGALDGTHVPAIVEPELKQACRNRKGDVTQNVLGVVDFDMLFTYILVGWEGSAHDGRVYDDGLTKGLQTFPGKYYLGDAGYALSWNCLTPYRGVRYHLKEWSKSNQKPQNKEELFNLRHSSLRNVIERTYGVVKKRFTILSLMRPYSFEFQCAIILSAFYVHNFIRRKNLENKIDDEFEQQDNEESESDEEMENEVPLNEGIDPDARALNAWRDGIAQRMWDSYLQYIGDE